MKNDNLKKTDIDVNDDVPAKDRNPDAITGEPGSHPVSTGVGAAGAGTIGVAIGTAVAGPLGGLVGAAVGAVVGGLGGSAVGEAVDPSVTNSNLVGGTARSPISGAFETNTSNDPDLTPFAAGNSTGTISGPIGDSTSLDSTADDLVDGPDHDQIAARAFRIYVSEGYPEGRSEEHWEQAKNELSRI